MEQWHSLWETCTCSPHVWSLCIKQNNQRIWIFNGNNRKYVTWGYLQLRLQRGSNFGDGDCGAGKIHTSARAKFRGDATSQLRAVCSVTHLCPSRLLSVFIFFLVERLKSLSTAQSIRETLAAVKIILQSNSDSYPARGPFLETPDNFPRPVSIFSSSFIYQLVVNWRKLSNMLHEIIKIKILAF